MKNQIIKLIKDSKYLKKGDILIINEHNRLINQGYGSIGSYRIYKFSIVMNDIEDILKNGEYCEIDDYDLYKISHHMLTEKKYSVFTTKNIIQNELIKRGFTYNENKGKWVK